MRDEKSLESMQKEYEQWIEQTYRKSIEKFPEREKEFTSSSFSVVKPLYTPLDLSKEDQLESIGFPGQYPFTRGIQPSMYRSRLWTMRQYAGFGSAAESNERYRYLLEQGQTGLSIAFDLPTQIGYDSDDQLADGEVGNVGVAVDTLADMEILFDRIPLDKVSTSMTINSTAAILLAMYVAVAEKNGVSKNMLIGTVQNDILKEYIARGTYIFPPKPSLRLVTDIFCYCKNELPKWNSISISGYHIREAGSTAAQEIGFTLADGIEYVKAAVNAGLDVDDFADRISFFFNAHSNMFEEAAKFRAARRLWARIMKERFGAKKSRSMMLRFHAQTAGSALTAQQADNNIARVTIQAMAAVLGGAQSLHTNSRDEAITLPTEDSVRIALRTQQIIAHESGIADTVDPLAGSYYVEALTDRIEAEAEEYIIKIDKIGGMIPAIELGYPQSEIQNASYRTAKMIERKEKIIVGMNKYRIDEKTQEASVKSDKSIQERQTKFLKKVRAGRSQAEVNSSLAELKKAAEGTDNLLPFVLKAVKAYASVGEICSTLRFVFGEYREQSFL
ncbi:MAG: methylmalonyl-CoA mutase family protein [Bacteroidetes bacterium]|nr:methylmalonyl-CoA mutase family protein [Bacteroidota bacterium]